MILDPVRASLSAAAVAVSMALAPAPATAQDWSGQITLYGWGAGVSGELTPFAGGPTLSFDASLRDVLEDLDAAFFATGLARRGNLVLFADLTYTSSSRDGLVPPGLPASGEVTLRSLTLAAGQRLATAGSTTVDVMGGLRAWNIDGRVSVPLAGVSVAPEQSFVDPIVMLRVSTPITDTWSLLGVFDVGGFGAGSDLTWQAALVANYQAGENLFLSVGYRHLYLDYRDGGTVFETSLSGPLLGVTWRF